MKRIIFLVLLIAVSCLHVLAGNKTVTVSQVTSAVSLTEAVDYIITGSEPFSTAGSIDIVHSDAVVIFTALKPSEVKSDWRSYITLNGVKSNNNNSWVGIYENGAIVYPHTKKTFQPLTVYTGTDFTGDSTSDFTPYTFYNSSDALGDFEDNVRSFKLKRGYMATFANMNSGQGYSRCFIAQDEDLEISELQLELAGRTGFIRVFPWNKATKKGYSGNGEDVNTALNTTWHYGWDAGTYEYDDYEYVPQHHHEGWPAWSTINGLTNCNTVLGNNEPDNTSGSEQYVAASSIESTFFAGTSGSNGTWISNAYTSGFRVGTPAMASSNVFSWIGTFIDLAEEYNCRLDFAAIHGYWYNTAWYFSHMCDVYVRDYDLPVWLTEFNYGANWTSWPGSDTTGSEENQLIEYNALSAILDSLEANDNCERYAIYNWVQDCRSVWLYSDEDSAYHLTLAGEYYSELQSNPAYTAENSRYMTWHYKSPTNLQARYYESSHRVLLNWTNMNGKQTDSTYVERLLEGEDTWTVLEKSGMPLTTAFSYSDTITGISGLITYRIHDFDSDNSQRYSSEVYVTIGAASGNDTIQYGSLTLTDPTDEVQVTFATTYDDKPAIFIGLPTYNNQNTTSVSSLKNTNISTSDFTYTSMLWEYQPDGTDTYDEAEEVPYMALPFGSYSLGDLQAEVGLVTFKDTIEVTFDAPFPEGVTPVVIGTIDRQAGTSHATMHKIWNVTNEGFTATCVYEDSVGKQPTTRQGLAYLAIAPGQGCIDEDNDIWISAGFGYDSKIFRTYRSNTFYVEQEEGAVTVTDPYTGEEVSVDTLLLEDPLLFAELQTDNCPAPRVLRKYKELTTTVRDEDRNAYTYAHGVRALRVVDESVQSISDTNANTSTADLLGWVAIHGTLSYTPEGYDIVPTGIERVQTFTTEDPLQVSVKNRIVYVKGAEDFELYTIGGVQVAAQATQEPGVYIVRYGKQCAKVLVK